MLFFSAPLTTRAPPTTVRKKRPKMIPIGVKLWENAFQTIPDISFFDTPQKKLWLFSKKDWRRFLCQEFCVLEELKLLSVTGRFHVENHHLSFVYFLSTILGGGVKVAQTVVAADLAPKMTFILNRFGCLRVLGSPNPGQSFGRGLSGPQATEVSRDPRGSWAATNLTVHSSNSFLGPSFWQRTLRSYS